MALNCSVVEVGKDGKGVSGTEMGIDIVDVGRRPFEVLKTGLGFD